MKKIFSIVILVCISAASLFAQTTRVPAKITPRNVPFKEVTEISDADWSTLATVVQKEDWKQSALLATQYMQTLKTDNDKKQLAQLRYIYIFSLAGQINTYNTQGNAVEAEKSWQELDTVMETLIGKEFVMPPRLFTTDCEKKLNVICQVKDTPNALRTTATNQEGNAIHSFDYVLFDGPVDIKEFNGKQTFLGGLLQKAEYNEDKSKPWILRLFFHKGFLRVVVK